MGSFSLVHWLVVALVIFLLFGGTKLPNLMGELGKGFKDFKKQISDDSKDVKFEE